MLDGVAVVSTTGSLLEVSFDGGTTWHEVDGVSSFPADGGEAPTSEVVTLRGAAQTTGVPRPQTITCEVAAYVPSLPVWALLDASLVSGEEIQCRYTLKSKLIQDGGTGTFAVSSAGVATFAGTPVPNLNDRRFARGHVVAHPTTNPKLYVLVSPLTATTATVSPAPQAAVAAAAGWKIYNPGFRVGPFSAGITSVNNPRAESEAALASTLGLAPTNRLPLATLTIA